MAVRSIDADQRIAARVAGFAYLYVNIAASINELFVRGPLIIYGNAAQTAQNVLTSERVFRVSIASDLSAFIGDVVLAAAFYVLLKPVNMGIALFGSFSRLVNAAVLAVTMINSFVALRLLSGAHYLRVFGSGQLQALAQLFLGIHDTGFLVSVIFLSLGSMCSSYLLMRSKYIPSVLAAWGVFGSALAFVYCFGLIILPKIGDVAFPWVFMPLLTFELLAGIWLVFKGIANPIQQSTRA